MEKQPPFPERLGAVLTQREVEKVYRDLSFLVVRHGREIRLPGPRFKSITDGITPQRYMVNLPKEPIQSIFYPATHAFQLDQTACMAIYTSAFLYEAEAREEPPESELSLTFAGSVIGTHMTFEQDFSLSFTTGSSTYYDHTTGLNYFVNQQLREVSTAEAVELGIQASIHQRPMYQNDKEKLQKLFRHV